MSRPEEPLLSAELSNRIIATHEELLGRFAKVKPNTLRGEIRRYCTLLGRLGEWAGADPDLWQLAHRARWWEWHWFEREFGDSQFVPYIAGPDAEQEQCAFDRRHVALLVPMQPLDQLELDLTRLAVGADRQLPTLSFLGPGADVLDFRFVLEQVTPTVRRMLLDLVERVVVACRLSDMTPEFLDLLLDLRGSFSVSWELGPPSIELRRAPGRIITVGAVDEGPAWRWIEMQELRRDEFNRVDAEAALDFDDLVEALEQRMAA